MAAKRRSMVLKSGLSLHQSRGILLSARLDPAPSNEWLSSLARSVNCNFSDIGYIDISHLPHHSDSHGRSTHGGNRTLTIYRRNVAIQSQYSSLAGLCCWTAQSFLGPFMVQECFLAVAKRDFGSHTCRIVSSSYKETMRRTAKAARLRRSPL